MRRTGRSCQMQIQIWILSLVAGAAGSLAHSPVATANNNNNNNPLNTRPLRPMHPQPQQLNLNQRPDSSSSFFADIEDLTDSNIRTRFGSLPAEPDDYNQMSTLPANALSHGIDFDHLMDQILQPIEGRSVFSAAQEKLVDGFSGHGSTKAADAQNRTTMRFFRNNKTFASIVYLDEHNHRHPPTGSAHSASHKHQARRLINCHLVDLEKHSSDVALFESKYDMKTIDIEFKDMMRLIESCTEVARVKRLKPPQLAAGNNGSAAAQQQQQVITQVPPPAQTAASAQTLVVVTRPAPQSAMRLHKRRLMGGPAPAHQPTASGPSAGKLVSIAAAVAAKAAAANRPFAAGGQRLVLGEVTPPPATSTESGPRGGIREALQEITSYDSTDLMSIWRGILPGTNWCGMGDRATSYNDLGFEPEIDICCRAHDFCPIRLPAFSSGYGLFNWSFYTRSHCQCDQNFLDCLQRAKSPLSAVVMKFYFNIMKTTCLHDDESALISAANEQVAAAGRPHTKARTSSVFAATNSTMNGAQYKLLLDQIRASLPIPALKQSLPIHSKLDNTAAPETTTTTTTTTSFWRSSNTNMHHQHRNHQHHRQQQQSQH